MAKPIALFVGKPFPLFISWLNEQGYEVHLFIEKNETRPIPSGVAAAYSIDFSSERSIKDSLPHSIKNPQFLVNVYENSVPQKALLAQFFNVPGPSLEATHVATDKFEMRTAFAKHCPEYSPQFTLASTWEEIEQFLQKENITFPLILKPTNLFKSLLVTKCNSVAQLRAAFDEGMKRITAIYAKEKVSYPPRFVVEEFLDGPSYSMEVFVDADGNTVTAPTPVDLVMGRDIGIDDNYNYSRKLPTQLSEQDQIAIKHAAIAGTKALGLTSSPAHVELVLTKNGPKLIEIGARTGGYRQRMHWLSHGVDLFQAQVDVAQGKLPKLTQTKNAYCAVYEIFPEHEGTLQEITNLEKLKQLPTLYYLKQQIQPGQPTGPAKLGYRFALLAIFASANQKQFESDTTFFEQNVTVLT